MTDVLSWNWSAIFLLVSVVILIGGALVSVGKLVFGKGVPAQQRSDALQRALKVAVAASQHEVDNPATPELIATMVNRYLGIYRIPVKVNAEEVKLLLVEANLILSGKLPTA